MNIFQKNEQRDVGWQYISLTAGNDEDGIFYCEVDNAIGSACLFPSLAGWDDKTPDAAAVLLNEPYPGGTLMQFIHFGSPHIRPVTETYARARFGVSGDTAVQTVQYGVRERAAFIERGSRHRLVPTTETRILEGYCLWPFKIPLKTQNPFSGSPKETEAFRKECDEFLKLRTRALSQLTVMGIQADILPTPSLMGVLRRYFSVYEEWDTGVEEETPLNEQLFPVGSHMNWDSRRYDLLHCSGFSYSHERQYIGLLAIDRYPGSEKPFHFSRMIELLGNPPGDGPQIGMPYALCTTLHFPEQQAKAAKVRANQGQVEKSANPLMLKWSPRLKKKREGYQQLAQLMIEGGNLVEASTSLCLFNPSANAVRSAQSTLTSYYKRFGFVMRPERYMPEVSFFNQLPLNASPESIKNTHRFKTMGGSHAAHLLPVTGEWQGFGNEMLLTTASAVCSATPCSTRAISITTGYGLVVPVPAKPLLYSAWSKTSYRWAPKSGRWILVRPIWPPLKLPVRRSSTSIFIRKSASTHLPKFPTSTAKSNLSYRLLARWPSPKRVWMTLSAYWPKKRSSRCMPTKAIRPKLPM